jgi:4-hydroxyphenylpyruvate dioxygenase-like putative hemolysin
MFKAMVATCALSLAVMAAAPADAALQNVNGYVCSATYTRQNNVAFGQGWVGIQVYTGANCTGSYVAQLYVHGPGAANLGFQFDQAERLALFQEALEAGRAGKRANFFVDMPGGGIFHTTYRAD